MHFRKDCCWHGQKGLSQGVTGTEMHCEPFDCEAASLCNACVDFFNAFSSDEKDCSHGDSKNAMK